MPTLEEIRARGANAPRPKSTHTVTLVTGQHLLDEQKRLSEELTDIMVRATRTDENGERVGPPRKASERDLPPRAAEIRTEVAALYEQLSEHQGEVTLVADMSDGEWLRWKDEHPPREDNTADERIGWGYCNTSDLYAELGRFVAQWEGEDVAPGAWDEWLAAQITFADKRDLVHAIVELYETKVSRAPKSPSSSSTTPPGSDDSSSPDS